MDYEQIEALAGVLKATPQLAELEVRQGETVLRLRRAPSPPRRAAAPPPVPRPAGTASVETAASPAATATADASNNGLVSVTSQWVGVFRAARATPVAVGDTVKAGQTLGHIEAMRLMNDCAAPSGGKVTALLAGEGQPVEYGQPLFEIAPDSAKGE